MTERRLWWLVASFTSCVSACAGTQRVLAPSAVATLEGRSQHAVTGRATFTPVEDGGVHIAIEVHGAAPGQHAIHLHAVGDCTAPDASSAGPHFDPDQSPHGGPGHSPHHAGDFGNLSIGADGQGYVELVARDLTLDEGPRGILGRALVVHEKVDDMQSQPAGNSGASIACGVIVRTPPRTPQ